jgi:diadenosine tetraphosphate (Ap4A) HIT family hydrolase
MEKHRMTCVFCESSGGTILWQDAHCRVVRPNEAHYPALCRVIWREHVKEMTDLNAVERARYLRVVFAVEQALRDILKPDKMNIASLGNAVPHLHWHVIPRFFDDRHFPGPIWAAPVRDGAARALPENFDELLQKRLAALG